MTRPCSCRTAGCVGILLPGDSSVVLRKRFNSCGVLKTKPGTYRWSYNIFSACCEKFPNTRNLVPIERVRFRSVLNLVGAFDAVVFPFSILDRSEGEGERETTVFCYFPISLFFFFLLFSQN